MNCTPLRLLIVSLVIVASVAICHVANADDRFHLSGLYLQSDHGLEGQLDTRFDQRLMELGRSPSERLFGNQEMNRYGLAIDTEYTRYDRYSLRLGGWIDPRGTIVGHSELGDIHMRTDTVGLYALATVDLWRVTLGLGPYVSFTEADVHSWLPVGEGGLLEYHDKYRDFNAGPVALATFSVTDDIGGTCYAWHGLGDVDLIGTDTVIGCGITWSPAL